MVAIQDTALTAASEIGYPPTGLWSDEPEMESDLHLQQMLLLISCLEMVWRNRDDFYVAGNMTVYYSPEQIKTRDFKGPDFFVVLGTERRPRKSWTIWEEGGNYPNLIIEILSDSTAKVDRTTKKELYQNTFRTPEYFWFDPVTLEFEGFLLIGGSYQAIAPSGNQQLWSQQLQLFLGIYDSQLRYFTSEGQLVPTPMEAAQTAQQEAQTAQQEAQTAQQEAQTAQQEAQTAQQEAQTAQQEAQTAQQEAQTAQQEAQTAQQEAQTAQQKNKLLAAKLRELGVDPDSL